MSDSATTRESEGPTGHSQGEKETRSPRTQAVKRKQMKGRLTVRRVPRHRRRALPIPRLVRRRHGQRGVACVGLWRPAGRRELARGGPDAILFPRRRGGGGRLPPRGDGLLHGLAADGDLVPDAAHRARDLGGVGRGEVGVEIGAEVAAEEEAAVAGFRSRGFVVGQVCRQPHRLSQRRSTNRRRQHRRDREKATLAGGQVCCSGMVKPVIVPASHSSGYCTHR